MHHYSKEQSSAVEGACSKGTEEAIAYIRRTFTKILYRVIHINKVYILTIVIF
ncbi:MAG: hypothetical protein KME50_35415 [Nostoc desertorum CM1-VF14]|nr:hypothetical protein [Nostoc desertorum CM1-VF14]